MHEPGALLARGRDADVFEYGSHLVLRRSRAGRSQTDEARTMTHLRDHGYPVPEVVEIDATGHDLVMERIDGITMGDAMSRAPWTLRRHARQLAELHQQLHELETPDFLGPARIGHGTAILHLDLHPLNVLMGPKGPVVIDWTNAAIGDPTVDVALAWVLMAVGNVPGFGLKRQLVRATRGVLVHSFLSHFDQSELANAVRDVVTVKVRDPHMSSSEVADMWRLVALAERSG